MNPYIEILRPGNALMGAISIILVAIIDKTVSIPVILAMITVFPWCKLEGEAQPHCVGLGGVVLAPRHGASIFLVIPAAAAVHSILATDGACRVGLSIAAVVAKPVLAPLIYVAAHVVQL
jgi:hypothetical protein